VVGVDGSPASMRALAWAASEAIHRGAMLEVVHVDTFRRDALNAIAPEVLKSEQSVVERAVTKARALEPKIFVTGRVCDPPAAGALIDASKSAEMLVVGSKGLEGVARLVLGSVSAPGTPSARWSSYRQLLASTDTPLLN
jgi:nucleotide-binding universal stress UspA family protein